MARLDSLFCELPAKEASDLHMVVGLPIKLRIHGNLEVYREAPLKAGECAELLEELVTPEQWVRFLESRELDFAYGVDNKVRLRGNYFQHQGGMGAVFRVIPSRIQTCEELGLPPAVTQMADVGRGLVLVTGPTGSGKSTTLAALVDAINRTRSEHIVTIEEPIEFLHEDLQSVIVQREVGTHTGSFADALRSAVRQDPNVILVGELRDRETMSLALSAAEMGFLVFGTLHTSSAAKTIDRIVDLFPPLQQPGVRLTVAAVLRGVVAQLLVRSADGRGRLALQEILVGSTAVSNILREGATAKLYSLIQAGAGQGMQTMDQALMAAVRTGQIQPEEAWKKARDKTRFEKLMEG